MSLDKKMLLILHVITKEIKGPCGTYMRVTVNKGIDKSTFTLSQAMNFVS